MHSTRLAFLRTSAALIAALALCPGLAAAQVKRVVVEDFRGPAAGRVRSQLVAGLQNRDEIEVVSRAEVSRAARELRIRRRNYTEDDYVQLARELNVAAFIDGRTSRRRRRWAVTLRVRSGADGMVLGSESWGGRTIGSLNAVRRTGYTRLRPHLDAAQSPAPQATQQTVVAATDGETPWYAAGEEEEGGGLDGEELEEEEVSEPVEEGTRQDALRVALVVGSLRRSMAARAFVINDCTQVMENGMSFANPSCRQMGGPEMLPEDRTYESGGVGHMEAGVEAVLYPGAFGDAQEIPWFGVVGSFRHSLFLNSFGFTPAGEQIEVPTTQSELYLGARGRYRFGEVRSAAEVTADIGYGNFSFELEEAALKQLERSAVLPPMSYGYLMLGAGVSYGFVPVYLRAGIEASWRLGLGVGDAAREVWGTQTTDMSGFSFAGTLHSEAPYIADGVYFQVGVEYFRFTTTFRGQTACVDGSFDGNPDDCSDREPWEPWPYEAGDFDTVTGGIPEPVNDDYLRLSVAIGYALR